MNLKQFHLFIVRPTLDELGLGGLVAERLVCGTALAETGLEYVDQITDSDLQGKPTLGPAYGLYSCEPITEMDCWRFLGLHHLLEHKVKSMLAAWPGRGAQLVTNLTYATAICRITYYKRPEPLPADNLDEYAAYWKLLYNTRAGEGTVEGFKAKASAIMELS